MGWWFNASYISLIIIQLIAMKCSTALLLILALLPSLRASSIQDPVSLAVTIYNDQFAMVKDVRSINFTQGRSDLYFTDVSSNIQTETVTFKALNDTENIRVFEQNYEANLVNTNSILERYINKNIEIYTKLGENSYKLNGTLLGYSSGYILQTANGIQVLNNIEGVHFPSLPDGFFTLPTLNWKVFSNQSITTQCEVAYRTSGFSWKSDYSVTLSEDESTADIGGWVSIDNRSGKRYLNAKLKLIAGDVNTVNNAPAVPVYMMARASPTAVADSAPSFSEKSFSDYHMYTLSEPVSLNDNSQKQVEFIPKVFGIKVRKYNLISISNGGYSQTNLKASNKIQFRNSKENGLGIPFPKGTVRVFKSDNSDGSLEFIGEDSIGHTPKDENITLTTGNAFDITANKYVSNYQSYGNNGGYSANLNLTIYNHKDISAEIVVELSTYYGDNLKINWKTQGLNVEKVSSSLIRVKRQFNPDEKFAIEWSEDYRP